MSGADLTNTIYYLGRKTQEGGFEQSETWELIESDTARIWSLSGTETGRHGAIDRESTHRMATGRTVATEADRIWIEDDPYRGLYLVLFVDHKVAPALRFVQLDVKYLGALQPEFAT